MTFEPADLKHAHNVTRYCTELSASLRKQQSGIGSRLSGFVKGTAGTVAFIKGMTKVERHVRGAQAHPPAAATHRLTLRLSAFSGRAHLRRDVTAQGRSRHHFGWRGANSSSRTALRPATVADGAQWPSLLVVDGACEGGPQHALGRGHLPDAQHVLRGRR
jgi:hypothetical protein